MQMEQAADIERSLSADLKEVRAALADAEKSLAEETASAKRRAKWKEQHMQQLEATEAACAERYSDNDTFFTLICTLGMRRSVMTCTRSNALLS